MAEGSVPRGSPYNTGYRRPPQHSQFRPGRSGNPAGRPAGSINYKTAIERAQAALIEVREGGRKKRVTIMQAAIGQLFKKAAKGSIPAIKLMINLCATVEPRPDPYDQLSEITHDQVMERLLNAAQRLPRNLRANEKDPGANEKKE